MIKSKRIDFQTAHANRPSETGTHRHRDWVAGMQGLLRAPIWASWGTQVLLQPWRPELPEKPLARRKLPSPGPASCKAACPPVTAVMAEGDTGLIPATVGPHQRSIPAPKYPSVWFQRARPLNRVQHLSLDSFPGEADRHRVASLLSTSQKFT